MLRAPEIQTIIKRERHDTPNQPQEAYFFFAKWIHCVAVDSENTQSTMRRRQGYAEPRPEAHFLCPFFKSRVALFRVPIGSMLWIPAAHSLPPWQLFHRQVRQRDLALTPDEIFDFLAVLLQHNEVKMVEVQKLANLRRESCSQFRRFAARSNRFADAQHGLIPVAVAFTRNHRMCSHGSCNAGTRHRPHVLLQPMLNDDSVALCVATSCATVREWPLTVRRDCEFLGWLSTRKPASQKSLEPLETH